MDNSANFHDMQPGDFAEVIGYNTQEKSYRRKLLSMGLTRGTLFQVTKIAPLGDPVEIQLRGFQLSLRKAEATALQIKKLDRLTCPHCGSNHPPCLSDKEKKDEE